MLSVLMSVYKNDNPVFFKKALESIYEAQTLKPSEVVIVKDGPLGIDLEMTLAKWETKNQNSVGIKVLGLKHNVGLGEALRIGLEACTNDIVARMDSDDISAPERFELQYSFLLKNPAVSLVGASIEEFKENENISSGKRVPPNGHSEILKFAKFRNPINHATVMFRKQDILLSGSYKTMHGFEDYYLWIRMLLSGYKIENIKETLLKVRLGEDFMGRRRGWAYAKRELLFLNEIYHLGFISRINLTKMFLTRFPVRLMPLFMLNAVYKLARKK